MAVNKVVYNDKTLIDISDSTVTPETLVEGAVGYSANGERVVGAMSSVSLPVYSTTEEHEVGTWIDGRTIYRRVISWSANPLQANKWTYYREDDLKALNIDQYINISGTTLALNEASPNKALWQPIPRICPDAPAEYSIGMGDLESEQLGVLFGTKYISATVYLTIDYVKKTS